MVMAAFPQDVLEMMESESAELSPEQVSTVQKPDIILYHTIDHTARPMFRHQAIEALKKRFPAVYPEAPEMAGRKVFSERPLGVPAQRAQHPCLLNPEHAEYAQYSTWGFSACHSTFISPYHVQRHMEKKHKSEWATIKTSQDDQRREEDRAIQREMLRLMAGRTSAPDVKHSHARPTGGWDVKVSGCPRCEAG